MRLLILGAAGMLGHKLCQRFRDRFDTWATLRSSARDFARYDLVAPDRLITGVDAADFDTVVRALAATRPDVVVNCIGIIKQLAAANDPIISLTINSLFPHRLANLCAASGSRMIHISTDCVFSGRKGNYTEDDDSDALDLYGRTKFLGETATSNALTLRTSIIGRELQSTSGLVEWFLANAGGTVQGYSRAIYTGFTTLALSDIIEDVIERQAELSGVWQVSSDPINKYDLLCLLREHYGLAAEIRRFDGVRIDRSLDSTRFRQATGFKPPAWTAMIAAMAHGPTPYEQWRNSHV